MFGSGTNCRQSMPGGLAAMAYAFLQNPKEEHAPSELVSIAKQTIVRDPLMIARPGNAAEIDESNTLRKANQQFTRAVNCKFT